MNDLYFLMILSGNASQISDGAAAVILARRSYAEKLKLPILAVVRSFAVVGVPPEVMGIGPAYAIPEALKKAGSYNCIAYHIPKYSLASTSYLSVICLAFVLFFYVLKHTHVLIKVAVSLV